MTLVFERNFGQSLPPGHSFSRASSATLLSSTAALAATGTDTPRFSHDSAASPIGLLLEPSASQALASPTDLRDAGFHVGASSTSGALIWDTLTEVTIQSGGTDNDRRSQNGISVTNGQARAFSLIYAAGTSGRCAVFFQIGSSYTILRGAVGALAVTGSADAGSVSIESDIALEGGRRKLDAIYTPNADSADFTIGVGPDSAVAGESVIALGWNLTSQSRPSTFIAGASRSTDQYVPFTLLHQRPATRLLRQAAQRPIDIVMIGDSNLRADSNTGFSHGFSKIFAGLYGLYASQLAPFGEAADTGANDRVYDLQDHGSEMRHASALLTPSGMPAAYDAFALPGKVPAVYASGFDTAANDEGLVVYNLGDGLGHRDALRYHLSIGSFPSGGQDLQIGLRNYSSGASLAPISDVIAVNTGAAGQITASYDVPADPSRSNHVVFDLHGDTATAYTGQFVGFWQRAENPGRTSGVALSSLYSVPGDSTTDAATWLATQSDTKLDNYLAAITYIQRLRGLDPMLVCHLNMGFNDRFEAGAGDEPETFKANVEAIFTRLRSRWIGLGYPADNIAFLATASHPRRTADAELESYRAVLADLEAESQDVQAFDFSRFITGTEIDTNGWYNSPTDDLHLSFQTGYEGLSAVLASGIEKLDEATVVIAGRFPSGFDASAPFLDCRDSADPARIALRMQTNSAGFLFGIINDVGGTNIETAVKAAAGGTDRFVFAIALSGNDMRWSVDGGSVVTETAGSPAGFDTLALSAPFSSFALDYLAVHSAALSNADLISQSGRALDLNGTADVASGDAAAVFSFDFPSGSPAPIGDFAPPSSLIALDAHPFLALPVADRRITDVDARKAAARPHR